MKYHLQYYGAIHTSNNDTIRKQVSISAQSQTTEVPNNARTDNILYSNKYKISVT